jgi:hypothetical protein
MADNAPRNGIGEYDKHSPIRGQPLNAINQQAVPLEGSIDRQVMAGELRSNISENHL